MLSNVTHSNSYFECNKKRGCIDQLYIELGVKSSNFTLAEAIGFYDQNSGRISEAICKISTRNVEKHLNRGY